jgi:CHAT domain-containing protein
MGARYALGYSPSLAILGAVDDVYGERWHPPQERWTQSKAENDEWLAKRRRAAALKSPLVFANPVMPAVRGPDGRAIVMPPLLAAESEGRRVAARLGTEARIGAQASEAAFLLRVGSATVVHLATHGYAYSSEERSGDSFIALAPGAGRDGLLSVSEVIGELPALVADLVVLSACQTGLGNLKQAEGTLGLQRAFLSRGARSVLVSLWNVSDESTARLMTAFYSHWLGDADHPHKAVALYRAQNEVRSQPEFAHPRYWAAFQLVGAR